MIEIRPLEKPDVKDGNSMFVLEFWSSIIRLIWDFRSIPPNSKFKLHEIQQRPDILLIGLELANKKNLSEYFMWSNKHQVFQGQLSVQNILRLKEVFGQLPVKGPRYHLERLWGEYQEFKRTETSAQRIKDGLVEDIQYKMPPLAEYQHIGVNLLVHSKRVPLFADCGCLAGDTEIKYSKRGSSSRAVTIAKLYKNQEQKRKNRVPGEKTKVQAFNGKKIILHPIVKVVESGVKKVFELKLSCGRKIKATSDHEILTKKGFVQLGALTLKDEVMVDEFVRHLNKEEEVRANLLKYSDKGIAIGRRHPYASTEYSHDGTKHYYLIESHRAIYEAHKNGMTLPEFIERVNSGIIGGLFFINSKKHRIHHINGDHCDNSPENLTLIPQEERGFLAYSRVVSVTPMGKEMTYDIVCEDPHRNFVANGIVVHNCGKTYMALVSTQEQFRRGLVKPGKVLVAGKLLTLETGWARDCEKFTHMKAEVLWEPGSGAKRREKILQKMKSSADIFVINHDGLRGFEAELVAMNFEKIIVDESTILKSFHGTHGGFKGGKFGKALLSVAHNAPWRVIMSGTPAPNSTQDLWGQMHFLDPDGFMLEKNIHDFHSSFMHKITYGKSLNSPISWVDTKSGKENVAEAIRPLTYRVRIRDHIKDLPDKTIIERTFKMEGEQLEHYNSMEERLFTEIHDENITVDQKITLIGKLRQITGGFIIDSQEVPHAFETCAKLDMLEELLLEEIGISEKKVIVYAQYRWEVEAIKKRFEKYEPLTAYGGNTGAKNLENVKAFIDEEDKKLIILHPKSAAHGITFTCAHYMVWYSCSHSAEDNYQGVARIERAGQKNPMFIYYLLAADSVDTDIFATIVEKTKNQADVIDDDNAAKGIYDSWLKRARTQKRKVNKAPKKKPEASGG
jgi:hypothetical protein